MFLYLFFFFFFFPRPSTDYIKAWSHHVTSPFLREISAQFSFFSAICRLFFLWLTQVLLQQALTVHAPRSNEIRLRLYIKPSSGKSFANARRRINRTICDWFPVWVDTVRHKRWICVTTGLLRPPQAADFFFVNSLNNVTGSMDFRLLSVLLFGSLLVAETWHETA